MNNSVQVHTLLDHLTSLTVIALKPKDMQDPVDSGANWNEYNSWNVRNPRMADFWIRPLAAWMRNNVPANSIVLDYGCCYFDLGFHLPVVMDGYDPNPSAIAIAKGRIAAAERGAAFLTSNREEIPRGKYNWIVANSVIQYFGSEDELLRFLIDSKRLWLKDRLGKILMSDILPPDYSAPRDAMENLLLSVKSGFAPAMIRHLYRAAIKPSKFQLTRYAAGRLEALAAEAGFRFQRLPLNVTPSRRRYTVLLESQAS